MGIIGVTISGWFHHRVQHLAAAFTFYALLSLGPLLVIALTIASNFLDSSTASSQTIQYITYFIGKDGASTLKNMIDVSLTARHQIMTTSIGILLLYMAASAVFSSLHEAMNIIWEVPPGKRNSFFTFLRKQIITVLLVTLIVALFLFSLITSTVLAALGDAMHDLTTIPILLITIMDFVLSVLVFTGLFAFIFKIVPDTAILWNEVTAGAFVTSILFNLGKYFISRILGHSNILLAYGSLASFIVIILWVYISAQIVLFGAEFTRAHILHTHAAKKRSIRKHNRNIIVKI